MQFKTDAQKDCYEKVRTWLNESFNGTVRPAGELPAFFIPQGSAILVVAILPWGRGDSVIQCRSYVVAGAELTPDLMTFLLVQNARFRFGSFGLDSDGDIILEHTLKGSAATKNEVQTVARMILLTTDKLDDEIVARWGGQRAIEPDIS